MHHANTTLRIHLRSETHDDESDALVSVQVRLIFQWIFNSVLCELVDIFGTITNIINIVCFVKLGIRDPVNISLLGLASSDLGCLITLIWTNICYNPAFNGLDLPFSPIDFQYLTGTRLHIVFTRVTGCITAFITLERCLCVAMPLKVKRIFTPTRVSTIIAVLYMAVIANMLPMYYVTRLSVIFSPARNKTIIGFVYANNRDRVEGATCAVSCVFVPLSSFTIIVVCTLTLVAKLRRKSEWRQNVGSVQTEKATCRDQKTTKMVIVISSLFIVCFLPVCLVMLAMLIDKEFSIIGKRRNVFICVFSVCFLLESINSAMNIFIYYYMSTKYRNMLQQMIPLLRPK
ncbi:hypothetical protein BsWGS_10998 [Bradybaena similaris]